MRIRGKAQTGKLLRRRGTRLRALCLTAALFAAGTSIAGATVTPPHVSTAGVGHVRGSSAQLEGTVNPNGLETSYYFQYGPTVTYGQKTKLTPVGHGTLPVKVGAQVTNLLAGYHYRLVAVAPNPEKPGTNFEIPGKDKSFSGGKSSKLKFVVAKGKEATIVVRYGSTAVLTGSLKGLGFTGKTLLLQGNPFPYTGAFLQLAGPVVSSKSGFFTFRIPHMRENTEVRVQTVDPRPSYSPTVVVHVEPAITLHVQRLSHDRFRFYGSVLPSSVRGSVAIEQLRPQKANSKKEGPRPRSVGFAKIKRGTNFSRFSVVISNLSGSYHYRAFIKLPKGPLNSGYSSHVLVIAPHESLKKEEKRKKHAGKGKGKKKK